MCFRPIGVFDSGVGGLNVLKIAAELMPNERFIYLADKARMPYGVRCAQEIKLAAVECVNILVGMNCKAVTIACNTATEVAIDTVRAAFPSLIVVGLEPAVKPCLRELGSHGYAVALVTEATSRSFKFESAVAKSGGKIKVAPLPTLASVIENNDVNSPIVYDCVTRILSPYRDAESVILGCSHYTAITPLIRDFYGGHIKIYDGAYGEAARLKYCLSVAGLSAPDTQRGSVRFYTTIKRQDG